MAKKLYKDKLIKKEDIHEKIKLIDGSQTDYISENGNVYKDFGNNNFFKKKITVNKVNGYCYCGITYTVKQCSKRVHVLVAKAFVKNPNNYPIVMHKDNNKTNNIYSNLVWGTVSQNTQQAFDDHLAINASGFDDSQSVPVCYFDLDGNYLGKFGSLSIAAKQLGITKAAIRYQCMKHNKNLKPRKDYYFRYLSEYEKVGFVL